MTSSTLVASVAVLTEERGQCTPVPIKIFQQKGDQIVEFFAFSTKLPEMAILASKYFTAAKESYPQ